MKATDLRGKAVVTIEGAEKLGRVEDVLIDTDAQRLVALQIKTDRAAELESVPVERIHSIGRDAITLEDGAPGRERHPARERRPESGEGMITLDKLLGTKVLSYEGNLLGTVAEVDFDPSSFQITEYEVSSGTLGDITGRRKRLLATPDIHFGKGIMTVPEEAYAAPSETEEEHKAEREEKPGRQQR